MLKTCRLLWADRRGHIGMINVDGSNERKIEVQDTLPEALSDFKVKTFLPIINRIYAFET